MCLLFINYSFYFFYGIICVRYKQGLALHYGKWYCATSVLLLPLNYNFQSYAQQKNNGLFNLFRGKLSQNTIIGLLGLMLLIV